MIFIITLLTFLFYYFASLAVDKPRKQQIFILCFISSSVVLRDIINITLNNDYYLYYNFKIFHKPDGFLSFLINEPYLYCIYSIFNNFFELKSDVFLAMYWFNFLINTSFFIWILTRRDVEVFKKMILFVLYYFVLGFVVLRNGPSYILFSLFFYYTFRDFKFKWVLLTPFMHISSCVILVTYFYRNKWYYIVTMLTPIILIFLFFLFSKFLHSLPAFESILFKINYYSKGMKAIGLAHKVFFIFVCCLFLTGVFLYKERMNHPILVTTMLVYTLSFFINPSVAHRFSPYILFALLLAPFSFAKGNGKVIIVNHLTVLLFPVFLYSLFLAHKNSLFLEWFS
ncbi:hypothetical protein [Flavobacterium sp. 7A]|uniref:hypothetical protein n=1 Tax=Flavobacterium sp. 7A TaxID=2940571 RepID=UPI00222679BE|nr:hypothetical protein [Flavobacterium sp. 7A]MCW2119423.1 hypothetical protein [Flavobacterium sp. 7A]